MSAQPPSQHKLPNIRRLFVPDLGYIIGDADLDRADLQVVVWEADDAEMKQMLHEGVDLHAENAKVLHCTRQQAKSWVHGTNYGGSARTMAMAAGVTTAQSEAMQRRWFSAHPGIKKWHERTAGQLQASRCVRNAFGFRRTYFDRIEGILPEALAWIPQSTVANVINKGLLNIYRNLPYVQLLLQVHDSLVFQWPASLDPAIRPQIRQNLLIEVPYPDPLIIPVGLKLSPTSWGDCQPAEWEP
jgi:DNA polymerase I-like protein with 3'-5' exonuclease and polymerase domains